LQLENADAVVLPGVGNFSAGSKNIEPFKEKILELSAEGLPILGVCLGMQLFFPESEEGEGKGLALFEGKNVWLPSSVKVPHMGWNTLHIIRQNKLLEGIQEEAYFYFVHSCYPVPANKNIVCAETAYGVTFASVVAKQNIYGTQFHPEKSGESGLRILRNFIAIVKR